MQYIITQANLDIQYAESMAFPTPNIFYSTGGSPPFIPDGENPTNMNEPYLDWLEFIEALGNETVPQTISTSYGDNEETIPLDYATSVCEMFAQLGARGITAIFSSGDGGVGGTTYNSNRTDCEEFLPVFPASCEFYTFLLTNTCDLLDCGCKAPTSPQLVLRLKWAPRCRPTSLAEGFRTTLSSRPTSKKLSRHTSNTLVIRTLVYISVFVGFDNGDLTLLTDTILSPTGRAYPDIAAQGVNFQIVLAGKVVGISGTSCSAPVYIFL